MPSVFALVDFYTFRRYAPHRYTEHLEAKRAMIKPEKYPGNADRVAEVAFNALLECRRLLLNQSVKPNNLKELALFLESGIKQPKDARVWDLFNKALVQLEILQRKERAEIITAKIKRLLKKFHALLLSIEGQEMDIDTWELKNIAKACNAISAAALFPDPPIGPRSS